jgi:hypothetical protein
MLLVAALGLLGRRRAAGPLPWAFAATFALAYLQLVCVQGAFDNYRGSYWYYDWWMHYDEALVFVGDQPITSHWGPYTLASRTPLFNLTTAAVMSVAGHDFAVYQLASALTNSVVVLALALLARDFFGRHGALLALLLAPLNLWLLHNAWFTWPKMLAAYYLLLGLHFYVRSVRLRPAEPRAAAGLFLCFWASSLLGFLTHGVGATYVLPLVLLAAGMALWRAYRPGLAELAGVVLLAALAVVPWYGWLLANLGTKAIVSTTPMTQGDSSAKFQPAEIAAWMSSNTEASLVPRHLLDALAESPRNPVAIYRALTELYFSLLTGALTLSLTLFLFCTLVRRMWDRLSGAGPPARAVGDWPAWLAVALFALCGWLGAAFQHPGKMGHGIAHSAGFPTALALAAVGWGLLSRARPWAAALICAGIVAEFLLMFWSHWWLLTRFPEVLEDLPGNADYKDETVVFLNDRVGDGQYVFVAGLVVVQLALLVLLVRWWRAGQLSTLKELS